ncbi:MAG TPA: transcriptional repressor [Acidobacteriota bacterium]|nr:transcriptional repressor [Acidobacteriota bacterium]
MKELLRTRGFKVTPQRELIFRAFFDLGRHVTVDELYRRVRASDQSVGYTTVWRNLKLICKVGLAEEVNLGDGVTRYDRITRRPHGHLYCLKCKKVVEFGMDDVTGSLRRTARKESFAVEGVKVEIHGVCKSCRQNDGGASEEELLN